MSTGAAPAPENPAPENPAPEGPAPVFVTRRVPPAALAPLEQAGIAVEVRQADDAIARAELLERVRGRSALICFLSDRIDAEVLDAAGPTLRIVANYAVGYDNVDVAACSARRVAVSNTPDVLTDATADLAMALLLAAARRVVEGHALVTSGAWRGWEPMQLLGAQVTGATLGIVGMGRIGQAVARRAHGFGMALRYTARSRKPEVEAELGAAYDDALTTLLAASDFVSLHTPLTDETRHLLGAAEFAVMKPTAILVNTARGAVIDEAALVAALRNGVIAGAGLDVFEHEPQLTPGLAELPTVVLTPHLGSATRETRTAMGRLCAEAVAAVLRGERVAHLLNPEVLG